MNEDLLTTGAFTAQSSLSGKLTWMDGTPYSDLSQTSWLDGLSLAHGYACLHHSPGQDRVLADQYCANAGLMGVCEFACDDSRKHKAYLRRTSWNEFVSEFASGTDGWVTRGFRQYLFLHDAMLSYDEAAAVCAGDHGADLAGQPRGNS